MQLGHDLLISVNDRVKSRCSEDFILMKLRICEVSQKQNSRENFRIYSSGRSYWEKIITPGMEA